MKNESLNKTKKKNFKKKWNKKKYFDDSIRKFETRQIIIMSSRLENKGGEKKKNENENENENV